jgi:nucleoid DNA-binding protein
MTIQQGLSAAGYSDPFGREREPIMLRNRYLPIVLLAGIATYAVLSKAEAQTRTKVIPKNETFAQRVARYAEIKDKDAEQCIQVIGKALLEDLKQGKTDAIPGLGSFRIVRVGESKDLVNGRPVTVPAYNVVEFSPDDGVSDAANGANVEAARFVPAFKYNILPGQTPGQKMPSSRMPSSRIQ